MNEALELVTRHGGQILEPPAPDGPARTPARTLATIADPEGNPIGLVGHAPPP
jgi:predicted enzyme related to lactoylglutathione lyase